jgi:hypothetical protein
LSPRQETALGFWNVAVKYLWILLVLVVLGCEGAVEPIVAPIEGYPSVITKTDGRVDVTIRRWSSFRQEYPGLNGVSAEFDELLGVVKRIQSEPGIPLFEDTTKIYSMEDVVVGLESLLDQWGDLFNVSSENVREQYFQKERSMVSDREWYHLEFSRAYQYPYEQYVSMKQLLVLIDTHGRIFYVGCEVVPELPIPPESQVSSAEALTKILGKELTYYDWGGKQTYTVSSDRVQRTRLVSSVMPRDTHSFDRLEYRLCWVFDTGIYDIFVDAITGEDLDFLKQLVIF